MRYNDLGSSHKLLLTMKNEFEILPWQQRAWKQVLHSRHLNRLHHAYLISGATGLGKLQFAQSLAQSLLCKMHDENGVPCNSCRSCHLFHINSHPDLKYLISDPEKKSDDIGIDVVRDLESFNELFAHFGNHKVIIIPKADYLTRQAANSLLKTLEEPNSSTILLLITAEPARLLPTIRSRCQFLPLYVPKEIEALSWLTTKVKDKVENCRLALQLTRGIPFAALEFLTTGLLKQREEAVKVFFELTKRKSNPLLVAENWNSQDLSLILTWLSSWLVDLLRLQTGANDVRLDNPDLIEMLKHYAVELNTINLHRLWSLVIETNQLLQHSNVNSQLLLEKVLIQWSEISS